MQHDVNLVFYCQYWCVPKKTNSTWMWQISKHIYTFPSDDVILHVCVIYFLQTSNATFFIISLKMHWKSHRPPCSSILFLSLVLLSRPIFLSKAFFHAYFAFFHILSFHSNLSPLIHHLPAFLFFQTFPNAFRVLSPSICPLNCPVVLNFSLTQIHYWFNSTDFNWRF